MKISSKLVLYSVLLVLVINISFAEGCPANAHEEDGYCYCNDGYVVSGESCISCDSYCYSYDIHSHGIVSGGYCSCACDSGYFHNGIQCTSCNAECERIDPNAEGYVNDGMCTCQCKEGYDAVDGVCVKPDEDCDNFCSSADPNSHGSVQGDDCYCECNSGYFYDSETGSCLTEQQYYQKQCDEICLSEPNTYGSVSGDQCYCYCKEGYLEVEGECVSETLYQDQMCNDYCADALVNSYGIMDDEGCTCYCEQGTDYIDGQCLTQIQRCDAMCKASDYFSQGVIEGEECSCYCIKGYWAVNGICKNAKQECDSRCKGEYTNSYGVANGNECQCLCDPGYVFEEGLCVAGKELTQQECNNYCSGIPNTDGTVTSDGCYCECKSGYVSVEGECKSKTQVKQNLNQMKDDKFSKDDTSPKKPKVPPIDEKTKAQIKDYCGLDVNEHSADEGAGKKAYIIRSSALSTREALSVGKKANLMVAYYQALGYEVRYVDRESTDAVFDAIADPDAGAVAYFSHGTKDGASIEEFPADTVQNELIAARARWLQLEYGLSENEAKKQATQMDQIANLDMFYAHTCYSANPGYKELADMLIKNGGTYYGEEGYLWSVETPHTKYTK